MIRLILWLSLLLTAFATETQQHTVAVTLDDLPAAGNGCGGSWVL